MDQQRMPAVFVGHGSPMSAVLDNDFTRAITELGRTLPRPRAILCVSAHWMTENELRLNGADDFETIYDFDDFPEELYRITYAPPTAAQAALKTASMLVPPPAIEERGLDHGAWIPLRMMYPKADVPVFQLSIDYTAPGMYHYDLGRRLAPLRDEGILILGSGNIVHNLGLAAAEPDAPPAVWTVEFDAKVKEYIDSGRRPELADYEALPGSALAVPTPDHYWPFLIALGAGGEDPASYPYEGFQHASLSMRAVRFG